MAGTTIAMSKLKQVLRWKEEGYSNRKIAQLVGLNKETVNNYISRAKADSLSQKELLQLDDYVLDIRLRGGNAAYTDTRFEVFKKHLPYFVEQMADPHNHVTLYQLWIEYKANNPDGYELTQFRYHYRQNTLATQKVSTILADLHVPGAKIYLDFSGDKLSYVDIATGELIKVQTFVACLPASDYAFAMAVPSQREEDFVYAFIQCLHHLGGVPKIIVPDNLKAAVIKANRYDPSLNQLLEDMGNHYGAVIMPARPRHPKDKANVEGMVKTIYNRVYAPLRNRLFYSLSELNDAIAEQVKWHNQKRMQLKPYTREEQFLSVEKPALRPLPENDFEIRFRTRLKVQFNGCILLGRDKHYYSVPHQYAGRQVDVDYTRSLVKIYANKECIATHVRDTTAGKYTLINEHLASHCQAWRSRSKEYYINKALPVMEEMATLMSYMFTTGNQPEEVYYNSCEALLHLQRGTDPLLFQEACNAALSRGIYSYKFVKNIVENKGYGLMKKDKPRSPKTSHDNIRGASAFQ